jgi:DNA-binding PadR family transcriptional regulator
MARPALSSEPTRRLLQALLSDLDGWRYGYDLSKETALKSGTLYPLLIRLEARGLLETRWEQAEAGRPPRHMYRLTPNGADAARALLREATAAQLSPRRAPQGA